MEYTTPVRPPIRLKLDVHLDVDAADEAQLFCFVDGLVADGHRVMPGAVARQLATRHGRGDTAIGGGVVIPHAALRGLPQCRLVYVRLQTPIDMNAPDQERVRDALVLLVRFPASPLDHALLEHIRDGRHAAELIDLLGRSMCSEAMALLLNQARVD